MLGVLRGVSQKREPPAGTDSSSTVQLAARRRQSAAIASGLAGEVSLRAHRRERKLPQRVCEAALLDTYHANLAPDNCETKMQGLLTSCANILYSSSLVTEILSLSVLSTTTITNFKKEEAISQRSLCAPSHTAVSSTGCCSHPLPGQALDHQVSSRSRDTTPRQSGITLRYLSHSFSFSIFK